MSGAIMKIGVLGYTGRVGQLIIRELQSGHYDGLELAGGYARSAQDADFFTTDDAAALFEKADILIDFTLPDATMAHIDIAAKTGKPLVIGTTGLSTAQEDKITKAAQSAPLLHAANMSVGVNMLLALVSQAAERLGVEWDIEVAESHHKHKIDSPSGTAVALGKEAAKARGTELDIKHDRNGARKSGDIGFAVQRGGDVVGEHMVTFYGEGERLQLGHIASDRALFAKGALRAAQWLHGKDNGLYTMRDALDL